MQRFTVFTSALDRTRLIGTATRSARAKSEGRVEIMVMDDGAAAALGSLAMRSAQTRLMQMEGPGSPVHGVMMRHIRSAAPALGWFRFAQAITWLGPVPAYSKPIGREGVCALIQDNQRKHA